MLLPLLFLHSFFRFPASGNLTSDLLIRELAYICNRGLDAAGEEMKEEKAVDEGIPASLPALETYPTAHLNRDAHETNEVKQAETRSLFAISSLPSSRASTATRSSRPAVVIDLSCEEEDEEDGHGEVQEIGADSDAPMLLGWTRKKTGTRTSSTPFKQEEQTTEHNKRMRTH